MLRCERFANIIRETIDERFGIFTATSEEGGKPASEADSRNLLTSPLLNASAIGLSAD